mmetsp:Transcript_19371/g.45041  ORF Transcript_19371/g.45041 Transcript_19371/m.45041 type:complete len:84 (-) Transcript_19371:28-279(-)
MAGTSGALERDGREGATNVEAPSAICLRTWSSETAVAKIAVTCMAFLALQALLRHRKAAGEEVAKRSLHRMLMQPWQSLLAKT